MDARRVRCYRHGPTVADEQLEQARTKAGHGLVHVVEKAMGVIGAYGTEQDVVTAIQGLHRRILGDASNTYFLDRFCGVLRRRPERAAGAQALRERADDARKTIKPPAGWVGMPMGYHTLETAAQRLGGTDPTTIQQVLATSTPQSDERRVAWFSAAVDRDAAYQVLPDLLGSILTRKTFTEIVDVAIAERREATCSALAELLMETGYRQTWAAERLATAAATA